MLGPVHLADLAEHLRGRGYTAGPQQVVAAARLLAALPVRVARDDLANWLAPVFCTSAREQREFGALFDEWLRGAGEPERNPERKPEPDPRPADGKAVRGWRARGRGALAAACADAGAVALAVALLVSSALPKPVQPPGPSPREVPREVPRKTPIGNATTTTPVPPSRAAPQGNLTFDMAGWPYLVAWAAMLAATAAAVRLRRRGFLERQPSRAERTELHLRATAFPALDAWRGRVAAVARTLRRRTRTASREFDVHRTIDRYCRAGMLTELFFGSREEPQYVVIIERRGRKDHYARIADELVHALRDRHSVHVEVFDYADTPLVLGHQRVERGRNVTTAVLGLGDLPQRFPAARLILFSDGASLIGADGFPLGALLAVAQENLLVIVTPRPSARWTMREHLLAQARLALVPLDGEGIDLLGKVLTGTHVHAMPAGSARPTPGYLRNVAGLLDTIRPDDAAVAALVASLRQDLGPAAFAWLCGCAAYPEIQWGLTIAIGTRLFPVEGEGREGGPVPRTALLVALSVLPWLRHGYMPDWLRTALLCELDGKDAALVQHALLEYLHGSTPLRGRATGRDGLRIAHLAGSPWRDMLRGWRAFRRARARPPSGEDTVYLKFMVRAPSPLAVSAGERVAQLFYQFGTPLGRPRHWPYVIAFLAPALLMAVQSFHRSPVPDGVAATPAVVAPVDPPKPVKNGDIEVAPAIGMTETRVASVQPSGREKDARTAPSASSAAAAPSRTAAIAPRKDPPESPQDPPTPPRDGIGPDQVTFTSQPTGRMTNANGPQYQYRFHIDAPAPVLATIASVTYIFEHSTFTQREYKATDRATGFAQGYLGWGCLNTIDVEIRYRNGELARLDDVPMCERINAAPQVETTTSFDVDSVKQVQSLVRQYCGREIDSLRAWLVTRNLFLDCAPGTEVTVEDCRLPCQRSRGDEGDAGDAAAKR